MKGSFDPQTENHCIEVMNTEPIYMAKAWNSKWERQTDMKVNAELHRAREPITLPHRFSCNPEAPLGRVYKLVKIPNP